MTEPTTPRKDWLSVFFLLTEMLMVLLGLLALEQLTNMWWALLAGSLLGVLALERAIAGRDERRLHAKIRAVAKKHLPGGRAA